MHRSGRVSLVPFGAHAYVDQARVLVGHGVLRARPIDDRRRPQLTVIGAPGVERTFIEVARRRVDTYEHQVPRSFVGLRLPFSNEVDGPVIGQ